MPGLVPGIHVFIVVPDQIGFSKSSLMPDARAEMIANTGHLVFLEAREKYDALVLGFLGK